MSFGRHEPPYHARIEEAPSDARIGTDRAPHGAHVGARKIAQMGDRIHEADADRQHGVARILCDLRGAHIHDQQRSSGTHEGGVEVAQDRRRVSQVRPDHDPVRRHEVGDRGAFLQELGVGAHTHRMRRARFDFLADQSRRAHGNRALGHDDLRAVHGVANEASGRKDCAQVRRVILAGRRAHGQEDQVRRAQRFADVGGESQPAGGDVSLQHGSEPGFHDGHASLVEAIDFGLVDIRADDVIVRFGHARGNDQSDIAGTDHGDLHGGSSASTNRSR